MYRSGKIYGEEPVNETTRNVNITTDNIQQNLESGAMISSKPMITILLSLCFGLIASFLL